MTRTAKLFASGGSQAVRLPADFRFARKEVFVYRDGERVVLAPKPDRGTNIWRRAPAQLPFFHERRRGPARTGA
jgi:antitoxin VapB